jgi:hypothetical protein
MRVCSQREPIVASTLLCAALVLALGCDSSMGDDGGTPPVDAGGSDAGTSDAGPDDAGGPGDSGTGDDGGGSDAGPGDAGMACIDPPNVPSSGTGTVLRDGVTWLTPVEGIATYVTTSVGGGEFNSTLRIRLTSYANACGLDRANQVQAGGREILNQLDIRTTSSTGAPLPSPGTYDFVEFGDEVLDIPAYRGAGGNLFSDACDPAPGAQDGPVGQLVLTTVTSTMIEGTYRFDGGPCCIEWSGTFSVPILDCAPIDPSAPMCCRAADP